MQRPNTHILLFGMPSTTFLHIKRVVESVIQKASLPVALKEVTEIQDILDAEIDTVPCLQIGDQVFSFSSSTASNSLLKKAITHLLQIHDYGDWPCYALPFTDIASVTPLLVYVHQMAARSQACLDLQYISPKTIPGSQAFQELSDKICTINEEPMGQILSRPIIGLSSHTLNICDQIVKYVMEHRDRTLVAPRSVWKNCKREIRQILPHLSAPLLSIDTRQNYHSKMTADWWIDPQRIGEQTFYALKKLRDCFDLDITIIASKAQKEEVLATIKAKLPADDFQYKWINHARPIYRDRPSKQTFLILNSSQLHPQLEGIFANLKALMDKQSFVALLPEKGRAVNRKIAREDPGQETEVRTAYPAL
ncbi:MAG: hypothetical protein GVX96_06450 [Bacteroidetes bacterium]|jgi:hypothetical protein|nr:hypothetical protein [Bacteroidota bacterium]